MDEKDSQITMPEKGRRKGREGMKGKEGGKEREKPHNGHLCKPRRCPSDLAQEMKPPAAGI